MAKPSQFSLSHKVAIVTGGGRGIGKAIATGLADAGANIVIAARTRSEIDAVAAKIVKKGNKAIAIPADVRKMGEVNQVIETTCKEFGRIDILVNNAGGSFMGSTLELSENGWDAVLRENLKPVFLCSQLAARVMITQKRGSIVNIASIVGFVPNLWNPAYSASKAAIISLTKTMALELAEYNVRVNAIAPGYIGTPDMLQLFSIKPELVNRIPLGRLGKPEEVASAVVYFASDASLYITGETVIVDGGLINRAGIDLSAYKP